MRKMIATLAMLAAAMPAAAQLGKGPGVLSTPGGRYVFGQISEGRIDQYLLDTQTGRLWTFITYCTDTTKKETCKPPVLRPVEFETQELTDDYYTPSTVPPPSASGSKQPPEPKRK